MAVTFALHTNDSDAADRGSGSPYTVGSATYDPGVSYWLFCLAEETDSTPTPTVTLSGMTWTLQRKQPYSSAASPDDGLCLFKGTCTGGQVTGSVTIEYASTQEGCIWSVVAGAGDDVGSAVVQTSSTTTRIDASTTFSIALSAFADAVNNGMLAACGKNSSEATNKEGGHTLISDANVAVAGGNLHLTVVWQTGEDTSIDFTTSSSRNWGGVAVEVPVAAGGTQHKFAGKFGGKFTGKV